MSAPNLKEIEWAIAELEREESSFSVYAKLADLYTVRSKMIGAAEQQAAPALYSGSSGPYVAGSYGNSEFLTAVTGKPPEKAWLIMDDLMDALQVVNRRAYDSVISKIKNL